MYRWVRTGQPVSDVVDSADVQAASAGRVDKPWGHELRFAITDRYLGKVIHVNQGEALSLQYHEQKDETLLMTEGVMDLELAAEDG